MLTGASAALLGYASTAPVVVAALSAVGAVAGQVVSGVLVASLLMGTVSAVLSARTAQPLVVVWSAPAAALLAGVGVVDGGFPAVVGAFIVVGLLVVVTGSLRGLPRALSTVPPALPAALCAGVLLPICLRPVLAVADLPLQTAVLAGAWCVSARWAPRASAGVVLVVLALVGLPSYGPAALVPAATSLAPVLVEPRLSWDSVLSIALPLYVVTMTMQNLVGFSVLQTFGYRPPVRPVLRATGIATALGALSGAPGPRAGRGSPRRSRPSPARARTATDPRLSRAG